MLLEKLQRKRPRLVDGGDVALTSGHDRAAKNDLELVREGASLGQAGFIGEHAEELVDPFESGQ